MLGFYEPKGENKSLSGTEMKKYSESAWRKRCGVVMQEGFIFSDTIANNIGVMDEVPDLDKTEQAVNTANIGEFIEKLPLRYNTKIREPGPWS